MPAQMQLRPFEMDPVPQNALMPAMNRGMDAYRQGMDQQFKGQMEREKLDLEIDEKEYRRRRQMIQDIGNAAVAVDSEREPARRAQMHAAIMQRHPEANSLPREYHDPAVGPRLIRAEAGKARDDLDEQYKRAQIRFMQARASHFNRTADAESKQRWVLDPQRGVMIDRYSGEVKPYGDGGGRADPVAGLGLDENGDIVGSGQPQAAAPQGYGPGAGGQTWQLPQQPRALPPPMRLGRGDDDLQVTREDGPQPVRVAQAGPPATSGYGYSPTPMEQAAARMYGPTGVTSREVPGVVTDSGRNQRMDVPATREAQGQRALGTASPDEQQRLRQFRDTQQRWTGIYGRQPRAGYYYGPDGREMPLADKNFKGEREAQATALMNLRKIEEAASVLGSASYPARAVGGYLDVGEIGQAYSDMKQAALGIAYALSGKQVAVKEMENFMSAYGPHPADSADRIAMKVKRLQQFYGTLIAASRGGDSYEAAFAKATSRMGVKNPDGSPVSQPGSPAGGPPTAQQAPSAPDLTGVSTEELLRRLKAR